MSEKLGKDESIARVYQFLSTKTDWKTAADKNGDGTIVQSEFRNFMLDFEGAWNGEHKYDSNDIISKFWQSVDVNKSGSANLKGVSNKNALDAKEIENMERNIKITDAINVLLTRVSGYQCPNGIKDTQRWMTSMQASLSNKASAYTGSVDNQEDIIAFLKTIYKESAVKTNADCIKDQLMNTEFAEVKNKYPDYKYMEDYTLNNIINTYIKSLSGDESFQDIMDSIKCLMQDYFSVSGVPGQSAGRVGASTAFDIVEYDENGQSKKNADGSASTSKSGSQTTAEERLNKYGGYSNFGALNDLQKEVLKVSMKSAIDSALASNSTYKDLYNANKADFKDLIDGYISGKISTASSRDFESLNNFNGATFISEKAAELDSIKTQIETLNSNRNALITKVTTEFNKTDEYAKDRKEAIKTVFGATATSVAGFSAVINGLSQSFLAAKEAEFDAAIKVIDSKLPTNFLSSLTDMNVAVGQTKTINLPNNYGSYTTGHLHYSVTGDSAMTVSDATSGTIEVKGNKEGVYECTVTVKDDSGTVLNTKTVRITVTKANTSDAIKAVTGWDNQRSTNLEAVLPTGYDDCKITDSLTDISFKDLYNKDYIVRLHISMDDNESWSSAGNMIDSRLDQLGNLITSALSTSNYFDMSKLNQAKETVIQHYKDQKFSTGALNDDDDGTKSWDLTNNLVWRMRKNTSDTRHRVVGTRDDDVSDSWVWGVRFKDIVNDIIEEYNKLI